MNTDTFKTFDNEALFYYEWNFKPNQKTLILIHRGHEYGERLAEFATHPKFSSYNIFAFDLRGHGHSKVGVSPVFMDYVRDLDTFSKFLKQKYKVKENDTFLVANSIGGVIVSAWVHDFAPEIAGMVLLAPAFEINLIVPLAEQFITLGTKLNKNFIVKSYVKSTMLTQDVAQQKRYDKDVLITREINGRLLIDLANHGRRLVADAAAITVPTLILSAEKDKVVINKTQKKFYVALDAELKDFVTLKDFMHGILFEKERINVYGIIKDFIAKAFLEDTVPYNLKPDYFTQKEYETMQYGLIPKTEKANFKFQKWSLGKIGTLSRGMAIGLKYGFDSGISLDYVYKNKPQGKWGVGKIMDKNYLNAIGWQGIRIRKQHLLKMLESAVETLQEQGQKIKILDIAGGTGNYLFDIKKKYPEAEIVVNDFVKSNIEEGEKTASKQGFTNFRFTNLSCFDSDIYQKLNFEPNITVISGIFELFGDNQLVNNAIKGVVSISQKGGFVIYTGQPWHPQLKMIAFVLKSHQDKDWVMRRRSQRELDKIMKYNHIKKESMFVDDFGIFTVSKGIIG
ncbi:MAG: alpha/beta fold hydrolase [Aestuariibaculum sp.]